MTQNTTPVRVKITESRTTTVIQNSCLIAQLVISCSDSGTDWTLKIQDKATSPFVVTPEFTLEVPDDGYPNVVVNFDTPISMVGGIDIITAGTAGEVDVWMVLFP